MIIAVKTIVDRNMIQFYNYGIDITKTYSKVGDHISKVRYDNDQRYFKKVWIFHIYNQ